MDWPKILVEYHQVMQNRLDRIEKRQEQALALALDAHKRGKETEQRLDKVIKDSTKHNEEATAFRGDLSEVVAFISWARTTAKIAKWTSVVAGSVTAIVAVRQIFFG